MKLTLLVPVIGLALGSFIGYHAMYVPQQGHARLINVKSTQVQADHRAQQEVAALLQQIEPYQKRLPPTPDTSWLVHTVVDLGHNAGLDLSTVTQETPQENPQFTHLEVTLQFAATYHQLGMFLDALERSEHFIRVDALDVTVPRDTDSEAAIRLTLSTAYLPAVLNVPEVSRRAVKH